MTKRPSLSDSMKALAEPTLPDPVALVAKRQTQPAMEPSPQPAKRYEGMKKMLIPIDPKIHRELRMMALQRDLTLEKIVQEAILDFVSRNN